MISPERFSFVPVVGVSTGISTGVITAGVITVGSEELPPPQAARDKSKDAANALGTIVLDNFIFRTPYLKDFQNSITC